MVFLHAPRTTSITQQPLETAAQFYGLNLITIPATGRQGDGAVERAVAARSTVAVAIDAGSLELVDRDVLIRATGRASGKIIPVFILGASPDTNSTALQEWTGGAILGCKRATAQGRPRYAIGRLEGVTQQLASVEFPAENGEIYYFELDSSSNSHPIAMLRDGSRSFPDFVEVSLSTGAVFLDCSKRSAEPEGVRGIGATIAAFIPIAPAMMFARYAAGEFGWHADGQYANLTVDDPWLRDRYGNLDYHALLPEMESHNFHTTIAFIPWNYERSQSKVVSLFREHPDRFSIAIHGDNHDHKEFTDYESKPLTLQIDAIKQALARMERFQQLTQIPYDKVMVFPHSIAPQETLAELKKYNYLGTVNSLNIPMGAGEGLHSSASDLRTITALFAGFPSIVRQPVDPPPADGFIAMNAFLENPLLFYCHEDFFSRGSSAFNEIADRVNRIEPGTRWRSLGEIIKHFYLVRAREDGGFDLLSFSGNIHLDNRSGRESLFRITKPEANDSQIASVTVDGRPHEYKLQNGLLELEVPVGANEAREVAIDYKNDLNLALVAVEKTSWRIDFLRRISDFRDIVLSRYAAGRGVIALYYRGKADPARTSLYSLAAILFFAWCMWRLRGALAWRRAGVARGHRA